jgi:hypothetical protein
LSINGLLLGSWEDLPDSIFISVPHYPQLFLIIFNFALDKRDLMLMLLLEKVLSLLPTVGKTMKFYDIKGVNR